MFHHRLTEFSVREALPLSEVLAAFSYALDLTEGQPAGHSVRACWLGMQIGQAIGLGEKELGALYYAVLLKDLGCSSNAARVAQLFAGDDRQLKRDFKLIGPKAADFGSFIVEKAGAEATEEEGGREAVVDHLLANGGPIMTDLVDTRCTHGADIARRLRFSDAVADAISNLDEHWDGSGLPHGISGEAIPLSSRIALLAQVADVFYMAGGGIAARRQIAQRRGSWFDPALADIVLALSDDAEFWRILGSRGIDQRLMTLEPVSQRVSIDEDYLDDIAIAFGQVIDAKSPFTGGHSKRVGLLTDVIGARLGLRDEARRVLCRAAMLHDVGKLGVSSRILEKPGKLDATEWNAMRTHAQMTVEILSRISPMRDMALIAGSHHERLDGRGYPLLLKAPDIAFETRIISVADFFDALTADRPYRAAMSTESAFEIMGKEVGDGIDPACFDALKQAVEQGSIQEPLPTQFEGFASPEQAPRNGVGIAVKR